MPWVNSLKCVIVDDNPHFIESAVNLLWKRIWARRADSPAWRIRREAAPGHPDLGPLRAGRRRHSGRESGDGLCSQVIGVGALDPRDAGPGL